MKRILLTAYSMECGGVENALVELIKKIPQDKCAVDLLLIEKEGVFLDRIPLWVNVMVPDINEIQKELIRNRSIKKTVNYGIQNKLYVKTMKLMLKYAKERLRGEPGAGYKAIFGKKKRYSYDIAIDFHGYCSVMTYLVAENVKAEKKYTWVHSETMAENMGYFSRYLQEYDKIFCVSDRCAEKARKALPESLRSKVQVFYNFMDTKNIMERAKVGTKLPKSENDNAIAILTVGRMAVQKGYDMAVSVAKNLKEAGLNFKWYFCGDGDESNSIKKQIEDMGLSDYIVMLGFQDNPYGYMKSCDIYVCCSRWEGYAISLVEAVTLGCPIITTDVSGAREEIEDGENGVIVNFDEAELTDAILRLGRNHDLREQIKQRRTCERLSSLKSQTMLNKILE